MRETDVDGLHTNLVETLYLQTQYRVQQHMESWVI